MRYLVLMILKRMLEIEFFDNDELDQGFADEMFFLKKIMSNFMMISYPH